MADRYRKKPVVIEAIQYRGDNLREVLDFTGKHPRFDEYAAHVYADRQVFKIFTMEGTMEALPGDWIIRGVKGELYPIKDDIFAATYEPATPDVDGQDLTAAYLAGAASVRQVKMAALVERAFRDGLTYGTICDVTDPDEAWRTSAARAALAKLRGE